MKPLAPLFSALLLFVGAASARAQAGDPMLKIDLLLRMQMRAEAKGDLEGARLLGATGDSVLHIFVKGDPARLRSIVAKHGGALGAIAGDIASARIPRAALHALAAEDAIARVEGARPIVSDNERAAVSVGAARVWTMGDTGGYTGRGVIVGTIDTGIDWTHPDFADPADSLKSRIVSIWDQNTGDAAPPAGFDYGSYWTRQQIEASLRDPTSPVVTHRDVQGHGTHVAGTAAGNGSAIGRFGGIAPDAEIVAVATRFSWSTAVFDAAAFIFAEADRLGRPAVINISLGFDDLPHDGNSLADEGIDQLLDAKSGRAVCASAGNSGESMVHWGATLGDSAQWTWLRIASLPARTEVGRTAATASVYGIVRTSDAARTWIAIGLDSIARSDAKLRPSRVMQTQWIRLDQLAAVGGATYTLRYRNNQTAGVVKAYGGVMNQREIGFRMVITDALGEPFDSARPDPVGMDLFRLMVRGSGEIHLWRGDGAAVDATQLAEPVGEGHRDWGLGYVVRSPGSARSVLTVGAYNNLARFRNHRGDTTMTSPAGQLDGALAVFSSAGPTLDGRLKPEIVAPGKGVISSLSSWSRDMLIANGFDSLIAEGGRHIAMSGTSMSSPVTAGAVALYLQKNPTATYRQIKEAIVTAAASDSFTTSNGPLPNAHWGYGKLDIHRAILGSAAAPPATRALPATRLTVRPNVASERFAVEIETAAVAGDEVTIVLLDALGRTVRTLLAAQPLSSRTLTVDASTLAAGLYFVRISGAVESLTAPVMLRR